MGKGKFMEHDFTSGSVWKKLLLFAVPIFGANLLQALYGTVDLFVVGLFADASAAERTVGSALWLFVTVGILLAVIVAVTAGGIASVMNAPAEAFSQTTDYIRICGIGIICIVMFNAIGGMFRGLGDSRTPLATVFGIILSASCVAYYERKRKKA